ncbi:MAG: GtrA family protein [Gordonia sp. (in: high G+C Gram-positive bacteria)]|uniref:GtrA family protein n=1 Tax=Gordonia sp. (in: high G+C Gram-positive bacteria) TaxID=84139 RepID=UPI0039E3386B
MADLTAERMKRTVRQFIRFAAIGASGVVVNMVVAIIMNKMHGGTANAQSIVWDIPGTAFNVRFTALVWIVGFLVANMYNFQLNRTFTFKTAQHASWWSEFWPFLVVGSVAAAVGLVLKIALTNPTSPIYLPTPPFHENAGFASREYWSQLIAIIVTMPINFLVNKFWTFRAVRHRPIVEEKVDLDDTVGAQD